MRSLDLTLAQVLNLGEKDVLYMAIVDVNGSFGNYVFGRFADYSREIENEKARDIEYVRDKIVRASFGERVVR